MITIIKHKKKTQRDNKYLGGQQQHKKIYKIDKQPQTGIRTGRTKKLFSHSKSGRDNMKIVNGYFFLFKVNYRI